MELVDVGDSKSPGGDTVPVRVRPRALFFTFLHSMGHTIHSTLKKTDSLKNMLSADNSWQKVPELSLCEGCQGIILNLMIQVAYQGTCVTDGITSEL